MRLDCLMTHIAVEIFALKIRPPVKQQTWNQYKWSIFKVLRYISIFHPKDRRVEIVIPAGLIDRIKLLCIGDVTEGDKQNVSKEYPTIGLGDVDVYTRTCIQWCRGVDTIKLNEPLPSLPFEREPSPCNTQLLYVTNQCDSKFTFSHDFVSLSCNY